MRGLRAKRPKPQLTFDIAFEESLGASHVQALALLATRQHAPASADEPEAASVACRAALRALPDDVLTAEDATKRTCVSCTSQRRRSVCAI